MLKDRQADHFWIQYSKIPEKIATLERRCKLALKFSNVWSLIKLNSDAFKYWKEGYFQFEKEVKDILNA